ncbi:MAG: DUF6452 family protein [Flavobacteriaceae bacterium]|nr:DUF6452 family protein [Flavobacteriaceae bacterium]
MKKLFLLLFLISVGFLSCERDDICIDDITPHLIIRFYDATDTTLVKSVTQLSVKILDIESNYIVNNTTDSIALPLIPSADFTKFVLTNDTNSDTIMVNYTSEAVFVGRSCGFKSIFNDIDLQETDDGENWIQSFNIISQQIENETSAHVKIFH